MILDRLAFATGDRLEARDLEHVRAREGLLHALHVRTLHGTEGVALGFAVAASADRRAVLVGPGLAYDRRGRAIVLARAVRIPLPAADGEHRLAAAAGGPRWCWLDGAAATAGVEMARVAVAGGHVSGTPDPRGRSLAAAPPRIGGGQVTVIQTRAPLSSIAVDTNHARFVDTPSYFAQACGPAAGQGYEPGALEPMLAIREEWRDGFTLDVRRLASRTTDGVPVPVAWIGVEAGLPAAVPLPPEEPPPPWCG